MDGGLGRNDSVLQAIADLAGITLQRPAVTEATSLGAGALAGLGTGQWDMAALSALEFDLGTEVSPELPADLRAAARAGWQSVLAAVPGTRALAGPLPRRPAPRGGRASRRPAPTAAGSSATAGPAEHRDRQPGRRQPRLVPPGIERAEPGAPGAGRWSG